MKSNKKELTPFEQKTVDFFTDLIIDYILKQEREVKEQQNNEQIRRVVQTNNKSTTNKD